MEMCGGGVVGEAPNKAIMIKGTSNTVHETGLHMINEQ